MRTASLVYAALLSCYITGCDRDPMHDPAKLPSSVSPSAGWTPPAGSLDAVFAEIVNADWQTKQQWPPGLATAPMEFISKVREEADFRRVDLDGDGVDERIICLNYSAGQKPVNQTFWIAQKSDQGWKLIGSTEGEPQPTTDATDSYMRPLDATWYNGGFEYTITRYEFDAGHYVAVGTRVLRPTEDPEKAAR